MTNWFKIACLLLATTTVVADDLPPGVVNTQNPADISLSPAESLSRITVPGGFHVTLFAGEPDVRRPIAFDFDDRGRLWVVENYAHPEWKADNATDRILIFEDTDHDGRFDSRKVFWDEGRYLTGIAIGYGGVWIANTPELSFIPDRDGDDVPDSAPIVRLDGFQKSSNNVLNNFHWGPDGWLYGAIGLSTPSLVGKPGTADDQRTRITRGIWRYHPRREKFEVLAEGMVNPWGADFNEYGDLITTNTVIAHLWHIVPGMYMQRRGRERDYPYAYGRIQSIANHLHWGGGQWQASRKSEHRHSVAGGGHAHTGAMIYLGDNWPDKYRGTLFTNNLHGNRVNNDRLVPRKSTYVGVHSDDFLFGNDPWFRGLSIKYGPDGGVYISDWHDIGECHDNDGSHRTSGRIFKVVHGTPESRDFNLQELSDRELADLHLHRNEWFVRHARRILHERRLRRRDCRDAEQRLGEIFATHEDETVRLRAFMTLCVMDKLDRAALSAQLRHENQHIRRWAVRFLADEEEGPSRVVVNMLAELALNEPSPKVRLALATVLQKITPRTRWRLAESLLSRGDDVDDPYLPLMIWYGVEPLVPLDTERALQLAAKSRIPLVRQYIIRRALDVEHPQINQVVELVLATPQSREQRDILVGMLQALEERGPQIMPRDWPTLFELVATSELVDLRSTAVRLATIFGDEEAISQLRQVVSDESASLGERRSALQALLKLKDAVPVAMLHELVTDASQLRADSIRALAITADGTTPEVLLSAYPELTAVERGDAIHILATRRESAAMLLTAVESGEIDRRDISAFALQQLRAFKDESLKQRINKLWAGDSQQLAKSDEIARYKSQLTTEHLATGDASAGRLVFHQTCAKCHRLFDEGGTLAPDLTGSGRQKLDYVLTNLVDPSATIDPAYRLTTIATADGRLLSGFIVQQDDDAVIFRTQDTELRLAMRDIDELQSSDKSMMPDGMLRTFTDEQVRDLIVYLQSTDQVPLPIVR